MGHWHELISTLSSAILVHHFPHVEALSRSLSAGNASTYEQLTMYAKNCVREALDYFQRQVSGNMKVSLAVFKAARLLSPQQLHLMNPTAASLDNLFQDIPFLDSELIGKLKIELPNYLSRAQDENPNLSPMEWWKLNSELLPTWCIVAKKMLLLQPSSASVERVFSLMNSTFGDQQDNSLQDYIHYVTV